MSHHRSCDCPKKEDFIKALQGEMADDSRRQFYHHVWRCPCCRPKLQVLVKVKAELETRADLVTESSLAGKEARALRKVAADQMNLINPPTRRLSVRSLPVAAAAAVGVVALALGYLFLNDTLRDRAAMRGPVKLELRLLAPGPVLQGAPSDFSWSDIPGRDDFRFILVDDELNTIYETETEETSLRLPEKERAKLMKGKTYLWTILALDDNKRELASSSRVFEVE